MSVTYSARVQDGEGKWYPVLAEDDLGLNVSNVNHVAIFRLLGLPAAEKMRAEYGRYWRKHREDALRVLRSEVEMYDQYLRGDIYGFEIVDHTGDVIDSYWGFYGQKWKTNGMAEHWGTEDRAMVEAGVIPVEVG